ncbi:MAG: YqjK-like family protein [Polynucleobacter sp.]|nr:YqjK-like family protein [Polynucleobacter sp.]
MRARLNQLLERQQHLIAKSAAQRATIAADLRVWQKPFAWVDRGLGIVQLIQNNRVLLYAAFALLASYKPTGARKLVVFAASTLKIAHHVRDLISPKPKV